MLFSIMSTMLHSAIILYMYMYVHTQMNSADPKTAPIGYFCVVVGNVNINMHLIEKLFMEVIRPNIQ